MINPISYYQVEQIRMEFGKLRIYLKGTEVFATENEIIPIPITPEILEKMGFIMMKTERLILWALSFGLNQRGMVFLVLKFAGVLIH